jgi:hypothetical protein
VQERTSTADAAERVDLLMEENLGAGDTFSVFKNGHSTDEGHPLWAARISVGFSPKMLGTKSKRRAEVDISARGVAGQPLTVKRLRLSTKNATTACVTAYSGSSALISELKAIGSCDMCPLSRNS